jgi:hypothetical protein
MGDAECLALRRGGAIDHYRPFATLRFRHESRFETRYRRTADLDNVERSSDCCDRRRTAWQG